MSHNKKRNTAFLFEVLSREATKAILNKEVKRASFIKTVLIKFFNNTEMRKELDLYKSLQTESIEKSIADRYLQEVKNQHARLDKKKIFNEQSSLISVINKYLGYKIYNTFIPNYKDIATISQIFNDKTPIKNKILMEQTFIENISSKEIEEKQLKTVDNIVYKTFANKFNEKYSNLLYEQKNLLSRYVSSFADDGLELKIYLNEEIGRLKEAVSNALKIDEVSKDDVLRSKTQQVDEFLKTFKDAKEISKEMLEKILKIQQFVHEVNK